MRMNGDIASQWDLCFQRNCRSAVEAWRNRWWYCRGPGASICFFASPAADTPLVRGLEKVDYEKQLGQLVAGMQVFVISKIPPATESVQVVTAVRLLVFPLKLDFLDLRGANATLSI